MSPFLAQMEPLNHHTLLEHLLPSAALAFGALFPILQPIAAVPVFAALTHGAAPDHQQREAAKASIASLVILLLFMFGGRFLLEFFGISLTALETAGGLVVGYAGWRLVTGGAVQDDEAAEATEQRSVYLTPMAIPTLAGPGAMGAVLALSTRHDSWLDYVGFVIGLVVLIAVTYALLRWGQKPIRALGRGGIDAMNRIFGLIVLSIAVEMVFHGVVGHVD